MDSYIFIVDDGEFVQMELGLAGADSDACVRGQEAEAVLTTGLRW